MSRVKFIFLFLITLLYPFCSSGQYVMERIVDPKPYGGHKNLRKFISKEMVYPESAYAKKLNGQVLLRFDVLKNGEVKDIRVLTATDDEFREEALRIFRKICWFPAMRYDIPERASRTMKIKFDYGKYKKWQKHRGYHTIEFPHLPVDSTNEIYEVDHNDVDPSPVIPETFGNFSNYIYRNLVYPEEAYRRNLSGKVELRFVVEPSGVVSNIHPIHAIGGGCTEEAVRLINKLRWNPAIVDGKAVRSWMTVEVIFVLPRKER